MTVKGEELLQLFDRYDRASQRLEGQAVKDFEALLDSSFQALDKELRRSYPELQSVGGLVAAQRQTLVAEKLGGLLELVKPEQAPEYQRYMEELLGLSSEAGGSAAGELLQKYESNLDLAPFTGISVEALANQAGEGVRRLRRYSDEFRQKANAIVGQGLIQGWGAAKVATALRSQLGVTKSKAETLARTEVMSALNQSAALRYQENGVEHVQWFISPSEGLCRFCADHNGRVYLAKDVIYPLHPRDRCFLAPWKPEWQAQGLTDDAFAKQYRKEGLEKLAANGAKPSRKAAPFERAAGLQRPPKAVWTPGSKKVSKPAPKSKPTPRTAPTFPTDAQLGNLEVVRQLGGSTGAELVRDPATGQQYVRKRGSTPDHLREEFAADAAYRAMGVPVPEGRLYEGPDGPTKLTEYIEATPLAELKGKAREAAIRKLQEHFYADALLGNWDVIGLSWDNVLVGQDGTPYRIDNGGAMRFRAQGAQKRGDEWNGYPTELWSMRSQGQAGAVFGGLSSRDIIQQIEGMTPRQREALLVAVPEDVRPTIQQRLDEADRMVGIAKTLRDDQWKGEYIDRFTKHSMGIRNAGIVERLPQQLELSRFNRVYDENGNLFDDLRGRGSITDKLADYIDRSGGDWSLVRDWGEGQGQDSWSPEAQAHKWQMAQSRETPINEYYWKDGADTAKEIWERATTDKYADTFAANHAWNYELLQAVDMPNNNREKGTFKAVRTESKKVVRTRNGMTFGDTKVISKGAVESTSMFSRVTVYGSETTVQDIPHHRVFGTYLQGRERGRHRDMFLGDDENELVAMMEGIPTTYIRKSDWQDAKPTVTQELISKGKKSKKAAGDDATSYYQDLDEFDDLDDDYDGDDYEEILGLNKTPAKTAAQKAESYLKSLNPVVMKNWTLKDFEESLLLNLGVGSTSASEFGSVKKKKTWLALVEHLQSQIESD